MKSGCMPGMAMPGCPATEHPTTASLSLSTTDGLLLLIIALSVFVVLVFGWRYAARSDIRGYSLFSDLMGHVLHAPGMILMSLLMLGAISSLGPRWPYMLVYGAFSLIFTARLCILRNPVRARGDLWHIFTHASMVYMFRAHSLALITIPCLVIYVLIIADYGWQSWKGFESGVTLRGSHRTLYLLGTTGHIGIALSMMLMIAIMQWPTIL